ncbi:MAG TPA: membrane-bound lytic murein transglycosylase MltF [Geothrix sp.]|nr:membrane-bound lytic murein transglycosylase MltF [Geothrix sp.]
MRKRKRIAIGLMLVPFLQACSQADTQLERVLQKGELRIITRNAATTYYEGPEGPRGIEYELAQGFAESLGVKLKVVPAANVADVLHRLGEGDGDLAAAGLTDTPAREVEFRFTPPYQTITQQVVYRVGSRRPATPADLKGKMEVVSDSSHAERLKALRGSYPSLAWDENGSVDSEELLALVWDRVVDYTVADSNELALNQRFYPELRVAFDISDAQPLAWAFRKESDDSLYLAAVDYFQRIEEDGTLSRLVERNYGHVENFDYVGSRTFQRHVEARLPSYQPFFQRAAMDNDLDWRLLAAMAYQESQWDPKAISPTGVKGMMMLTSLTASDLGVDRRTDVDQSIDGGARYLKDLLTRLPGRIDYPDRLWFALAAYNVGLGHLEDARVLTEMRGGNPDLWKDVKESLPLLSKRTWYLRTRYGYARGNEPVKYVENIRSYYDILLWSTDQSRPVPRTDSRFSFMGIQL